MQESLTGDVKVKKADNEKPSKKSSPWLFFHNLTSLRLFMILSFQIIIVPVREQERRKCHPKRKQEKKCCFIKLDNSNTIGQETPFWFTFITW